jgi:hypothetical protein
MQTVTTEAYQDSEFYAYDSYLITLVQNAVTGK